MSRDAALIRLRLAQDRARIVAPETEAHWDYCDYPGDMPGTCTCDMKARLLWMVDSFTEVLDGLDEILGAR